MLKFIGNNFRWITASLFVVMILLGISYGISATLFGSLWPEIYGTAYLGSIRAVTVSAAVFATAAAALTMASMTLRRRFA
jgi:hypothetical protein